MKLHILSDLHLEVNTFNIPKTDADVIILAGDIHEGSAAVKWIQEQTDTPVVYITGNHEYYGHFCPELKYELRRICPSNRNIIYDGPEIHFLENQSVVINGVRFLGCTLWTENTHEHRDRNIAGIGKIQVEQKRIVPRVFTSSDTLQLFEESIGWLSYQLEDKTYPTVVVTHHAPSYKSNYCNKDECHIQPHNFDRIFMYMSGLDEFILKHEPAMWIHGHLHVSQDYHIGKTRVVCNSRGREPFNLGFDPAKIVEV